MPFSDFDKTKDTLEPKRIEKDRKISQMKNLRHFFANKNQVYN